MICRVCGREYEPCRTAARRPNVFHWQEVACSPECGAIYLQRIIESRELTEKPADAMEFNKDSIVHTETEVTGLEPDPVMAEAEFSPDVSEASK